MRNGLEHITNALPAQMLGSKTAAKAMEVTTSNDIEGNRRRQLAKLREKITAAPDPEAQGDL